MEILQMKVVCGVNFIKKKKNIRMNLNEYELMKEKKKDEMHIRYNVQNLYFSQLFATFFLSK